MRRKNTRMADGRDVQELRDRTWRPTQPQERSVLVGVVLPNRRREVEEKNLDELARLSVTAGAKPVGRLIQERAQQDVRTYIGKGKVEELHELCDRLDANLVIFDDTLSPAQARNLEAVLKCNVIDRSELILDIFARHARSREAMVQVELAQLEYMRPRLRRLWEHLSRQDGGIGTRGPGETQLEVDRRRVNEKISHLKRELRERSKVIGTKRKARKNTFDVALVGYTNAGKSSLMNRLSGSDVLIEDKLFSTLDPTTRRLSLGQRRAVLLTDTVGFIRKLPHDLVESFRSTLNEVNEAELILHVVDAASTNVASHIQAVNEVLSEILQGSHDIQIVFNKIDQVQNREDLNVHLRHYPKAVFTSALTGEGVGELRTRIKSFVAARTVEIDLLAKAEDVGGVISFCYREGTVAMQEVTEDGQTRLRVRFSDHVFHRFLKVCHGQFQIVGAPSQTTSQSDPTSEAS